MTTTAPLSALEEAEAIIQDTHPNPEEEAGEALIVTDEDVLRVEKLNIENINDGTMYEKGVAYIDYPYFYIYRGVTTTIEFERRLPGIYLTQEDHYIWIPVTPGNEDADWIVDTHFATADQKRIIDVLLDREDIQLSVPENGKVFRPEESPTDDILKRAIKRALAVKGINIDDYKANFADKNALFNFKQVVKGDGRLSMLLFERGCNALHLKYTITIEDADPRTTVGTPLINPVVVSSEDTFAI